MPIETIAAIATPAGPGALAILRLSGPQARAVAAAVLRGALEPEPRRARLATAWDQEGDIDQVVALFFPTGASPTGEDLIELTCHGSVYIQRRLLGALLAAGARAARPGEFTQRAFLHGRLDLAQAEAVCDLIQAGTRLAHRSALIQLQGGLSSAVTALRSPVLDLLTDLEARLDHPDEDLPALPAGETQGRLAALAEPMERLAETFRTGRLLRDGLRVCIVGRPNAGKSSLLNALLGSERAIVAPEPGTTRDTIEEPCDLAGLPAVLVDTAGLGHDSRSAADVESLRRAERALACGDLALLVVDGSRPLTEEDRAAHRSVLEASARDGRPVITVLNKCDLPRQTDLQACGVSALRGTGLSELKALVGARLGREGGASAPGGVSVSSQRHHAALRRSAAELREAARRTQDHPDCWEELVARHLRECLLGLDELTGPAAPDEVLSRVFSRFCIGK